MIVRWLLISLLVLTGATSRARTDVYADDQVLTRPDDEGLRHLITARNAEQLFKRVSQRHRLSHDRLVCDTELRTGQLPVACFRYLSQNDVAAAADAKEFSWLQQLCRDRAHNSKDRKDLERAGKETLVPANCREIARERAADLRYADESERPAELFDRLVNGKSRP